MNKDDTATRALLRALHLALVYVRADAGAGNTVRIAAIADAFHELPVMLAQENVAVAVERFIRLLFVPPIRDFPELSGLLDMSVLKGE